MFITWSADMAAASIKLQTRAAALLLFAVRQHMDVHWSGWKVLDHNPLVRAIEFVRSVDATCVPICPENVLSIHGHGKWVNGCAYDDLTVSASQGTTFNLLSDYTEKNKQAKPICGLMLTANVTHLFLDQLYSTNTCRDGTETYKLASAQ